MSAQGIGIHHHLEIHIEDGYWYGIILILAILYSSAIVLRLRLFRFPMPKLKRGM